MLEFSVPISEPSTQDLLANSPGAVGRAPRGGVHLFFENNPIQSSRLLRRDLQRLHEIMGKLKLTVNEEIRSHGTI